MKKAKTGITRQTTRKADEYVAIIIVLFILKTLLT